MENRLKLTVATAAVIFGLAACGGGGGGSSDPAPAPTKLTGALVDSPVANISFQTATQSGSTSAQGEFSYLDGETVTFSIGELAFPTVAATPVVTPLSLAGTNEITDQQVINITRLLQSLDEDGDPSNGITIPAEAAANAAPVNFDVDTATFENNEAVINLVANSGSVTTSLITEAEALDHLTATLEALSSAVVSAWSHSTVDEENYLTLFSDGTFVYAEPAGPAPNGLEAGTYLFDPINGEITFTVLVDLNSDGGIKDDTDSVITFPASETDTTLTVNGDFVFDKVPAGSTGAVGVWRSKDLSTVLALGADDRFLAAEIAGTEPNGLEAGGYVYDPVAGTLTFDITYDDNGPGSDSGVGDIGTPVVVDNVTLSNGDTILSLFNGLLVFNREF